MDRVQHLANRRKRRSANVDPNSKFLTRVNTIPKQINVLSDTTVKRQSKLERGIVIII